MPFDNELALLFRESGLTVSLAESCTGGLIAARITDIPGCSAWFKLGVVAYHNDAKYRLLDVPQAMLAKYGAVSEEVARAMAEGVRVLAETDIAVSVTGIAGPDGGVAGKPVGTVFIALADADGCSAERYRFDGDRDAVRQQTVEKGLFMLKKRLAAPQYA